MIDREMIKETERLETVREREKVEKEVIKERERDWKKSRREER
jgi:hypothetical protein